MLIFGPRTAKTPVTTGTTRTGRNSLLPNRAERVSRSAGLVVRSWVPRLSLPNPAMPAMATMARPSGQPGAVLATTNEL